MAGGVVLDPALMSLGAKNQLNLGQTPQLHSEGSPRQGRGGSSPLLNLCWPHFSEPITGNLYAAPATWLSSLTHLAPAVQLLNSALLCLGAFVLVLSTWERLPS